MPIESASPPKPIASGDIAWEEWAEVPRFGVRYRHLGRAALGEDYRVGVAIEELAPGKQSSPAHYHMLEEEHVFILAGELTLCLGAETYRMKTGDYVCFPAGQKVAHCLVNEGDVVCRYVIVGERNPSDVVVYPYTNKVLVRALGRRAILDLAATRGYWDGEDTGAAAGEPPSSAATIALEATAEVKPPLSSHEVAWDEWALGPGFVDRNKHLTAAAMGENAYHVGILIEGPPPGMRGAPRHYHMLEEEHALVLEGEVTLLFGDARYAMKAGDYVCFPAGQKVGHSFLNSGTGTCSYLMIGEKNPSDVCVLTDSNKMMVRALRMKGFHDMSAVRDYLDGEGAA
jgi:uncharacterized cupin superfamily protein